MIQPVCFLQTDGLYVTEDLADIFYDIAVRMTRESKQEQPFKLGNWGEGVIETKNAVTSLGSKSGIEFQGRVSVENRDFRVSFVINAETLIKAPRVQWMTLGEAIFLSSFEHNWPGASNEGAYGPN